VYQWRDVEALGQDAIDLLTPLGLRSICAVPLTTPRDCHGVLMVGRPDDLPYSAADVALLEQVAHPLAIAIENALAYRRISDLRDRLVDEKVYLEDEVARNHEFEEIVGNSRALAAVLHQVRTVAPTDATVLLTGETGTGKELVARALHGSSRRHARSFIRINSAALPVALVESELFGYERGAFPARFRRRQAGSSSPIRERCFSTKSASFRSTFSRSCCVRFRSTSSSGWAARRSAAWTCGSSRPPLGLLRTTLQSKMRRLGIVRPTF
jgi:transcriptional regulator of acetoin/glycerol metabolism